MNVRSRNLALPSNVRHTVIVCVVNVRGIYRMRVRIGRHDVLGRQVERLVEEGPGLVVEDLIEGHEDQEHEDGLVKVLDRSHLRSDERAHHHEEVGKYGDHKPALFVIQSRECKEVDSSEDEDEGDLSYAPGGHPKRVA